MNKKEAVTIILHDLIDRMPKTNKDGFLPNAEVVEAVTLLLKWVNPKGTTEIPADHAEIKLQQIKK